MLRLTCTDGAPSYIGSDKAIADLPIFGREVSSSSFCSPGY